MGARFRMKASFDASGYGPHARTVIAAMKTYGLVLADNGSPFAGLRAADGTIGLEAYFAAARGTGARATTPDTRPPRSLS